MFSRKVLNPSAPVVDRSWRRNFLFVMLFVSPFLVVALPSPLTARTKPPAVLDSSYLPALASADRFLQAWQSGDVENGMVLLTDHAKEAVNTDVFETFFSNHELAGYEIDRGKLVKHGRYEFPIVLVTGNPKSIHVRRRFSSIVVVNTGNNEWAVDKLP
jgi:hypothetical protein